MMCSGKEFDDEFMKIAFDNAMKSKDPNTKNGACIVNASGYVVGKGFNKAPEGTEQSMPWECDNPKANEFQWLKSKYPYVIHADVDAIMNKTCKSLEGCTLFTLLFPWNEGAKLIVESGIKNVVFYTEKRSDRKEIKASKNLFKWANVRFVLFETENRNSFEQMANKTVNFGKRPEGF